MLLENDGIHHFAVLLSQIALEDKKKHSIIIFHPRRMQCTNATLSINRADDGNFDLILDTGHYKLDIGITPEGKLIRYVQGDFEVHAE